MSSIRHVIWDFNGTLLDDVACSVGALCTLLEQRSLPPITTERYREEFGFPVRDFYVALGFDLEREDWAAVSRAFVDRYLALLEGARPHGGAHDALRYVAGRSLGQSVLSAMEHGVLVDLLQRYGLHEPMQLVRGLADHNAASKVQLGRGLFADIGLSSDAVVVVGDTLHDFETANALGCRSVLVTHGYHTRARLERETRRHQSAHAAASVTQPVIVDTLADVVDWIERHAA